MGWTSRNLYVLLRDLSGTLLQPEECRRNVYNPSDIKSFLESCTGMPDAESTGSYWWIILTILVGAAFIFLLKRMADTDRLTVTCTVSPRGQGAAQAPTDYRDKL